MYARPYHDAGAPSIERGVEARLRRLDSQLVVTWSPYTVDALTGQLVIDAWTHRPVYDPGYSVWLCVDGDYRFVKNCASFGHREVGALERDVGRHMNPAHVMRAVSERQQRRMKVARDRYHEAQRDKVAANKKRIGDLVFDGKTSERQARIFSAPNVGARGTPGLVRRDSREDGWELPQEQEGIR